MLTEPARGARRAARLSRASSERHKRAFAGTLASGVGCRPLHRFAVPLPRYAGEELTDVTAQGFIYGQPMNPAKAAQLLFQEMHDEEMDA